MKITTNQAVYDEVLIDRNWIKNISGIDVDAFMIYHGIQRIPIRSSFAPLEFRTDIKHYDLSNNSKILALFLLTFI